MEHRQVEGIDVYNFPADLLGHPSLAWMGNDYVRYIAIELLRRFRDQDAGTAMLAIKCEEQPKLLTSADEQTGRVSRVVAEFKLQVLLQASNGQSWRLFGDGKFTAVGLNYPEKSATLVDFIIRSTQEAL